MRHRHGVKKMGRNGTHRRATLRNMAIALFDHERIITTHGKAKALRPFAEKLITLAKEKTLHNYRRGLQLLQDEDLVHKLFEEIGPAYAGFCVFVGISASPEYLGIGGENGWIFHDEVGKFYSGKKEYFP